MKFGNAKRLNALVIKANTLAKEVDQYKYDRPVDDSSGKKLAQAISDLEGVMRLLKDVAYDEAMRELEKV